MSVPVYGTPQVAPEVQPGVRVGLESVGAGAAAIGEGIDKLGGGMDRLTEGLERYQRRANRIAVGNGLTQFVRDRDALLYGDLTQNPPPQAPGVTGPQPLAGPGAAAGAAAGGGGVGAAVGATAGQLADDEATHEPATGPSQAAAEALYNLNLAPQGLFNARGMDALKYAHPTLDALSKRVDAIADGMPNAGARALFMEEAGRQLEETRGQVERHAYQQQQVAQQASYQSLMASSFGAINKAADFFNPGEGEGAIEAAKIQMAPVERMARELAATPEEGDQQVKSYEQEVYGGLVKRYIDAKDWKSAQAVLDGQADALRYGKDGESRYALWQRTVEAGEGQSDAATLVGGLVKDADRGADLHDVTAFDDGLAKLPPEQRTKEVLEEAERQRQVMVAADRTRAASAYTKALSQYTQGNNDISKVDPYLATWMRGNDPEQWLKLEDRAREDAKAYAASGVREDAKAYAASAEKVKAPKSTPEQDATYYNFRAAMADHPELFRDQSPDQLEHDLAGHVTQQQLNKVKDTLIELKGKKPAGEGLSSADTNLILQGLKDSGLNDKHPQTSGNTEAGRAYTQAEDALQTAQQAYRAAHKGADMPLREKQQVVGSELAKVQVQQPWYRPNTSVTRAEYESNPAYRGKALVVGSEVPKDWDAVISARAPNATPAQKLAIYQTMLRQEQGSPISKSPPDPRIGNQPPPQAKEPLGPPAPKARPDLVHPVNAAVIGPPADNRARGDIMSAAGKVMEWFR